MFCFYQSTNFLCPSKTEEYFTETNYSKFDKYEFDEEDIVYITAIGSIDYIFSFKNSNKTTQFIITGTNYDTSRIKIANNLLPVVKISSVGVIIDDKNNTHTANFTSILFNQVQIYTSNKFVICTDLYYTDFYSLANITEIFFEKEFTFTDTNFDKIQNSIFCTLHGHLRRYIYFDTVTSNLTTAFYNDSTIFWYNHRYINITLRNTCNLEMYLNNFNANVQLRYYCLLSYLEFPIQYVVIVAEVPISIVFSESAWPMYNTIFSLSLTGKSTITSYCQITPCYISHGGGDLTINAFSPIMFLSYLNCFSKVYINGDSQLSVDHIHFADGAMMFVGNDIVLFSRTIKINRMDNAFLYGNGHYSFNEFDIIGNDTKIYITNLEITENLKIKLNGENTQITIDELTQEQSEIYFTPPQNVSNINQVICKIQIPSFSIDQTLKVFIDRPEQEVYYKDTLFYEIYRNDDSLNLVASILEEDLMTKYCMSYNEFLCPLNSSLVTDLSQWPPQHATSLPSIYFHIDKSIPELSMLSFKSFKQEIKVYFDGNCVLDSDAFLAFEEFHTNNSKITINHPVLNSKSKVMSFQNTTVCLEAIRLLKSAENAELDYITAKSISSTASIIMKNCLLYTEGHNVTVVDNGIYLDDVFLRSKTFRLAAQNNSLVIKGNMTEHAKDEINIEIIDSPHQLIIEGSFTDALQIIITDTCYDLIAKTKFLPVAIEVAKAKKCVVHSELNHLIFSTYFLIFSTLEFDVPVNSIIEINRLRFHFDGEIVLPDPNSVQVLAKTLETFQDEVDIPVNIKTNTYVSNAFASKVEIPNIATSNDFTMMYRFTMSQLPFVNITSKNFPQKTNLTMIYSSSEIELTTLKNFYKVYIDPIPIACGQYLDCSDWTYKFSESFFTNYTYMKCMPHPSYGKCYSLVIDHSSLEPSYKIYYYIFGAISIVIGFSAMILGIRMLIDRKHANYLQMTSMTSTSCMTP